MGGSIFSFASSRKPMACGVKQQMPKAELQKGWLDTSQSAQTPKRAKPNCQGAMWCHHFRVYRQPGTMHSARIPIRTPVWQPLTLRTIPSEWLQPSHEAEAKTYRAAQLTTAHTTNAGTPGPCPAACHKARESLAKCQDPCSPSRGRMLAHPVPLPSCTPPQ